LGNHHVFEIRDLLASGLEELGIEVDLRNERHGFAEDADWHVVIAPHEFFYLGSGTELCRQESPVNLILVNTEHPSSQWFLLASKLLPKAHRIWDLEYQSSQVISNQGFASDYLPLGYLSGFRLFHEVRELPQHYGTCFLDPKIRKTSFLNEPLVRRPIDVMFVGNLTPRREAFFAGAAQLLSNYLCYLHFPDTWAPLVQRGGSDMDATTLTGLAQRSKIILNVRPDEEKYSESHRIIVHGIWHRALVMSEPGAAAPPFEAGKDFIEAPLKEIPEKIRYYLSSREGEEEAQALAAQGFRTLTEHCRLTDCLRSLILRLYGRGSQIPVWNGLDAMAGARPSPPRGLSGGPS
jgi:hypothetical protein